MKYRLSLLILVFWVALMPVGFLATAQTPPDYEALVHKGNAQLQAHNDDLALSTSDSAIKEAPDRWEAYALAGGALMNLKRYEDATDKFSKAMDRAPEAKQAGLRDLRKRCLLAEAGVAPAQQKDAAPTSPAATSQAEVVLWKSIENSTDPADFQSYLKRYPNGAFAVLAQRHLHDLDPGSPKAIQNLINTCENSVRQASSRNVNATIRNLKEFEAYANASKIKDPQLQALALRGFLAKYPNSVVRETILESLMMQEYNSRSTDAALADDESILTIDSSNPRALLIGASLYLQKTQVEPDPGKKQEFKSKASTLLLRCTSVGS